MDIRALKKEFKQKSKEENAIWMQYKRIGTVVALVGLVIALATLLLNTVTDIFQNLYPMHLILMWAGLAVAAVGGILDIIGDHRYNKAFEDFLRDK